MTVTQVETAPGHVILRADRIAPDIARNFVHEHTNVKEQHKVLVWGLQGCYTDSEYKSRLSWIEKELGSKAMAYLKNIPPERWYVFANILVQPPYGWRTSNLSSVSLTLGLRGLPPFDFIKAISFRIMSRTYKRSQAAAKWLSEGRSMTPAAMKVYESQSREIGKYRVDPSSDDVSFVYNQQPSMQVGRRVTISKNHCTCGFMDQHYIPCRHLISVLKSRGELDLVFNHFAPYYQVSSYAEVFLGKTINLPLHEEIQRPDGVTKSPPRKKPLGRPPTKRKRSKGETTG
ncbi:LOW QUALITY PROTEIN: Hypothetical protein PHPALM_8380 [Phytophthora palmivora]|uniref:SWIM-type domain-containing protein n=1 Tax=Phytophthora palmivora TaxID=4796 RepID=A0A2P4YA00_9STRA|nr:LOW QUALITY PROTEIN: Hypothetical protein PHPALM_8380 [Phytophthora palmivora]